MRSSWKLVDLGDRKYRLEASSGRLIGWIHGHAIGLFGWPDEREARRSVPALRRALDDVLMSHYPGRYRPVRDFADLRVVHDGAYEWIAAGNVPIARLHRPHRHDPDSLALEFVLPAYASEAVTIACAELLAAMLPYGVFSDSVRCEVGKVPLQRAANGRRRHERSSVGPG